MKTQDQHQIIHTKQSLKSCVILSATDLRIGNLLITNNLEYRAEDVGKVVCVVAIDSEREFKELKETATIYHLENKYKDTYGQWIKFLSPISLTEGLLLKLGAIRLDFKDFPSFNLFGIQINFINGLWIEYVSRVEIKGLHHLQNIFFFRNSEELQIGNLTEH